MELHAGLAVVVVGIERRDRGGVEHRVDAPSSTGLAFDDESFDPLYRKPRTRRGGSTDNARRRALRGRVELAHGASVEIAGHGRASVLARAAKVNRSTVHRWARSRSAASITWCCACATSSA